MLRFVIGLSIEIYFCAHIQARRALNFQARQQRGKLRVQFYDAGVQIKYPLARHLLSTLSISDKGLYVTDGLLISLTVLRPECSQPSG
jgi:hypothetical protein